ncbi:hypothetical protein FD27_GL000881 [Limosilactobacillus frumenti DSM 13145]|uniref:Uncharacterized protein n=2 Tax=Limosilactobacillus frumenti TaxID=104955 RepID=A0A0R1PEH4_9LACO|nr:hypothetical protein FD27_GL000881 [Limosilactobacillus frumenti DSM 13145]
MTLAVGSNCLVTPIQASIRDQENVRTSMAAKKEIQTVTRKIIVVDPHFKQPQVQLQTVHFVKQGDQWQPLNSNFLPPFFPVQYDNYSPLQTAVKPLVVSPGETISDVTIKYRSVDLSNVSPHNQGFLHVIAEDADGDKKIETVVKSKLGEWLDFPPAPTGYEYMCNHPDKIYITKNAQNIYLPVKKSADDVHDKIETKRVTRRVVFKLPSGDKEVIQEAYAKRMVTTSANGMYRQVSPWQIDSFSVVDAPQVDGHSSSVKKVPAQQLTMNDFDKGIQDVIVSYTPNEGESTTTTEDSHEAPKDEVHQDVKSKNEATYSQTDDVVTNEAGNQTDNISFLQTSNSAQTAEKSSSTVGTQPEVTGEKIVQKKQDSSSATQTDKHVFTATGVQTDEEKTSNDSLQTATTQTSDVTVQDNAVETVPVTGVTVDSQTEATPLTDTSSQTNNPTQDTTGSQTDRLATSTTDAQTDETIVTDSGAQVDMKPENENSVTQTDLQPLVTTDTQTNETAISNSSVQTDMKPENETTGTQTDHMSLSKTNSQTDEVTVADLSVQTEPTTDNMAIGTQTKPILTSKDEEVQTNEHITSKSSGMQTEHPTQVDIDTQTTIKQPIMISTAQQTENQAITANSAGEKGGKNSGPMPHNTINTKYHAYNQGTPTDDLVTVPINKDAKPELAKVDSPKVSADYSRLERNNEEIDPSLANLFTQDQALRRSLEQEKLPQTSNETDNRTTLVGMLLTLLAGFLAGRWIKAYYQRRSK